MKLMERVRGMFGGGRVVRAGNSSGGWIVPAAAGRWIGPNVAFYTPQMVETVFRQALAGDLTSQWEMFDLMEATWPRLAKNLAQLKDSVVGQECTVMAHRVRDEEPTKEAEKRAQLVEELLWGMHPKPTADENDLEDTMRDLMDARGKGLSVLEIDWTPTHTSMGTAIGPRCTRWVHPKAYAWHGNELMLRSSPESSTAGPFPDHKFIVGIAKARTGSPLGTAMLHTLGWWWAASNFTGEWFLNFAQVFGQPIRIANYDPGMSGADQAKLAAMLEGMGSAAWGMFPAGTTMELKEAAKGAGDNPQLALLKMADEVCDLLVLRQTLTSDVSETGGARALGEVHERVLGGVEWACAKWTCKQLQQLVRSICILNFGDDRECPWLVPGKESEEAPKELAEVLAVAANAGLEPVEEELGNIGERLGFQVQRKAQPITGGVGDNNGNTDLGQDGQDGQDGKTAKVAAEGEIQATALNGAQVTALAGLAEKVATGQLPADAAKTLARAAFPLVGEDVFERIFGELASFVPRKEETDPEGVEVQRDEDGRVVSASAGGEGRGVLMARTAENLGVPAGWLRPLRDVFAEVERLAGDEALGPRELDRALETAIARVPEVFGQMDVKGLAEVMEVGMGEEVVSQVRKGIRKQGT